MHLKCFVSLVSLMVCLTLLISGCAEKKQIIQTKAGYVAGYTAKDVKDNIQVVRKSKEIQGVQIYSFNRMYEPDRIVNISCDDQSILNDFHNWYRKLKVRKVEPSPYTAMTGGEPIQISIVVDNEILYMGCYVWGGVFYVISESQPYEILEISADKEGMSKELYDLLERIGYPLS